MSEGDNKASVQHTPAEWICSNQDQYNNADNARYHSEKVYKHDRYLTIVDHNYPGAQPGTSLNIWYWVQDSKVVQSNNLVTY